MDKIYYILIGILIFIMIYMVTDDNCSIENFTQINENDMVCNNKHAINYRDLDNNVDNSFCSFSSNVICHRPFSDNYLGNVFDNKYRCSDMDAYNYENEIFVTNSDGSRIPVNPNDLDELGRYCGVSTDIDASNKVFKKNTQEQLFKVKKCSSIDVCKYIENKICKYPMSNLKINSLKGITFGDSEFSNLILKKKLVNNDNKSELVDLDIHELMPGNFLTAGPHLSKEDSELRKNLKNLYTRLFNNDGGITKNEGLNLWDINGKVELGNLIKSDVIDSYLDNSGKIVSRKGYSLSKIPKNYYELVYELNKNNLHAALAVNDIASKYAIGIGSTKSEAADVALIRCITFMSLKDIVKIFQDKKNILINVLHDKLNVVSEQETKTGIWDAIKGSVGAGSNKFILNPLTNDKLKKISEEKKKELINSDSSSLGKKLIYLTSHKDIVDYYKVNLNEDQYDEISCKVKGNHKGKVCSNKPNIEELLNYIYFKSKVDNRDHESGLLMIDNKRYINVDLDASFIENSSNCNVLDVSSICPVNKKDCQEVAIIGYNSKKDKCSVYQDSKDSLLDEKYDYRKLPELDESNNIWINEKKDILKNDKVDLILENIKKCKKSNDKCILYKVNNKVSTYDSLH